MLTLWVALTVVVVEQALMDLPVIAVSICGVCANTQGSFDCDFDGTCFGGPICDSCKYSWRTLPQFSIYNTGGLGNSWK